MNPTKPAIPRLTSRPRRAPTLVGVAPCANAPFVEHHYAGSYRTANPRAHRASSRTREAIRVDFVRRGVK